MQVGVVQQVSDLVNCEISSEDEDVEYVTNFPGSTDDIGSPKAQM